MLTERWVFPAIPEAAAQARAVTREIARRAGVETLLAVHDGPLRQRGGDECDRARVPHDREPGQVELEARRPHGGLCLSVRDHGCGMEPRSDSPGAGLGLGLIAQRPAGCRSARSRRAAPSS